MKFKLITITLLTILLTGCPIEGDNGNKGSAGINCWDLNSNRVNDQNEDINHDGSWDALDCTSNTSAAQSPEADLNHQHICEALANLGQYPEGCPSITHTVPAGTLTNIGSPQFFDDGMEGYTSCNNSPNNGLLSIKARDFVNPDGDTVKQAWFELEGGYIAKRELMPFASAVSGECQTRCQLDSNCVASLATRKTSESSECNVFYHSDTVSKYERICGIDSPGLFSAGETCLVSLGTNAIWASKCP